MKFRNAFRNVDFERPGLLGDATVWSKASLESSKQTASLSEGEKIQFLIVRRVSFRMFTPFLQCQCLCDTMVSYWIAMLQVQPQLQEVQDFHLVMFKQQLHSKQHSKLHKPLTCVNSNSNYSHLFIKSIATRIPTEEQGLKKHPSQSCNRLEHC